MVRPPKVVVNKKVTINMYSELWHASGCVLETGLHQRKGSSWQFLSSAVLSAFAFEAYLNHVGVQVFDCWEGPERLPPMSKFELLCETLKIKFSEGKGLRPLQTIAQLMDFRNTMAHGRTETIAIAPKLRDVNKALDQRLGEIPLARWQTLIQTPEFAQKVRKDVEAVLTRLHEARPDPKEALFTFGMAEHSATMKSST